MENALPKIKKGITSAPIGAIGGAVTGMLLARALGYHKSITIIPFTVVGMIVGYSLVKKFK
jgi:hypothetical protein